MFFISNIFRVFVQQSIIKQTKLNLAPERFFCKRLKKLFKNKQIINDFYVFSRSGTLIRESFNDSFMRQNDD